MNYAEKIRAHIEDLREEDAKRYLGDIVVKYVLKDQPLTADDEYIESIQTILKLVGTEEIRKKASKEVKLDIPELKL
ncbi:hypothetical protein [Lysinibacillus sp. FW12]|uniref:hypothetical protein n=1 Tax=Lysinibacillus sp. FW12 TaxID=3096079 RepID=UPI003D751137